MNFGKRIAVSLLGAALMPFGVAMAADYEPPIIIDEAPEVVPVEVGSGWYLRGDIGYVFSQKTDSYTYRTFDAGTGTYGSARFDEVDLKEPFTFGAGFGYHFNDLLRADFTVDGMRTRMNGQTFSALPCTPMLAGTGCRSEDRADVSAISFMANGYVDLGTVAGFTPYVGAGAGYTYVSWSELDSKFYCVGGNCPGSYLGLSENGGAKEWRFTWQAMAGVAYAINKNLKVDLGYRYRQIEKGDMFDWDAGSAAVGATGIQGRDGDLEQHEVRIGLRYDLW
ncbi:outer membrane protein [Arvimicrobium flavum]|uniref:outer membrane protein n=1 Tax=Arvimicrobium flavum TaxID=3393320 RepID=UPI00237A4A6F|nr:outer membrane protein [Mesorhizobium shangrilense]